MAELTLCSEYEFFVSHTKGKKSSKSSKRLEMTKNTILKESDFALKCVLRFEKPIIQSPYNQMFIVIYLILNFNLCILYNVCIFKSCTL